MRPVGQDHGGFKVKPCRALELGGPLSFSEGEKKSAGSRPALV